MLRKSFRSLRARNLPRAGRDKPLLLLALILAGCGGAGAAKEQVVRGQGFSFDAPARWKVEHSGERITARHDSELVQVSTFLLVKPYRPALYDAVARELSTRMRQVAQRVGGGLEDHGEVVADGIRSHVYRVTAGDHVDEYTFVFTGRVEYQLLCRRMSSTGSGFCKRLVGSFRLA
jgi:hypothetical protein